MRVILIVLYLLVYFTLSLITLPLLFCLGKINPSAKDKISQVTVRNAFRTILFLAGTKITVRHKENVPDEPVLFVGNHSSYFDIITTYSILNRQVGYVAKIEMEKTPLLSSWMRNIGCVFLNRQDVKEGLKAIIQGVSFIKEGRSMFIFPEGTRNHSKTLLPFKEGSTKMAEKAGCKIVPVAITNTDAIFENNKWYNKIRKASVTIEFGSPIEPKSLEKEQKKFLGAYVQSQIEAMLQARS